MQIFLKAKHWQIFMIIIGLPVILEIIAVPFMIIEDDPRVIMTIMPIIMIYFFGGFCGWCWAVAINLQEKLADDLKLSVKGFKIFLLAPLIYYIIFFFIIDFTISGAIEKGTEPNPTIFAWLAPLHLITSFCILYCFYFVSKIFKTVELQRKVTFSDFAGEFFMICFYFIGIWILQPKINKMVEDKRNARK